ncbi:MAG: ATP-binding protein [Oscillatoria sp. PMC 1068.18]|nr:ATP-binding protein [Oscillatoria sp. PMC 1076.18]MEC4988335.1 ATP-binding protein [Oscillatoria sp. PMC 1068.18]
MRSRFQITRAWIGLCVIAFVFTLLFNFHSQITPTTASARVGNNPPVEVTTNWQYRWGNSPVNDKGMPLWIQPEYETYSWTPLSFPTKLRTPLDQKIIWLKVPFPDRIWPFPSISFQGIPYLLEAYLDDQLIYIYHELDSQGELIIKGDKWPIIPLEGDYRSSTLFLRVYAGDAPLLSFGFSGSPTVGSQPDLIKKLILKDIDRLILGWFFIFCGLFPLLIAFFKQVDKIYFSFGLLAITIGIYTVTDTEFLLLVFDYPLFWKFLHYASFNLAPAEVCIFFENIFGSGYKSIVRRLWQIDLVYALSTIFLVVIGLFPWSYSSFFTQLFAIVAAIIMIVIAAKTNLKDNQEAKLFTTGFSIFLLSVIHDILIYVNLVFFWNLTLYYWGMLVFILFLAFILERRFTRTRQRLQANAIELEAKNEALQKMDKLKDEFLANTSHELRTPLNGMIGIAESLIDGATGQLSNLTNYNLALIISSGKRLTQLVNDLLDFSRLRHQNLVLQIKPIAMREIADIILTISQHFLADKNLKLINNITSEVPLVDADENRVQQILYNLVGNAIKFTENGQIEVSAEVKEPFLVIRVRDTGIGIPTNKLEQIFAAFEQGDGSISRQYGGTGLGLAVTKELVELHGGEIEVESTLGQGSVFSFSLPLSTEPTAVASFPATNLPQVAKLQAIDSALIIPEDSPTNISLNSSPKGEFKILIVDDEPVNRQVLINHLSLLNYAVKETASGIEALDLINHGYQPDLILLDVMMPKMTGYAFCQVIRQKYTAAELPIVLLTAKNQVSDLVEGFNSGANDYLTKPIAKHELLARIKTHIQLSKINLAYGRFVPREFLKFLERESIIDVQLGDQVQQKMTVLFSDIRSFTSISESMSPKQNFDFLNSYLSRVGPVIRSRNGFIDKYIGDAVMALFPDNPDDALQAAIEMQRQVALYNSESYAQGYPAISIGVGLHTGNLMLGTIGEKERMESTVISDAVNLASRLEGLTKGYGANIVVSDRTLFSLPDSQRYSYRFLGRVRVKGKRAPVAVFEVFDSDAQALKRLKLQTRSDFEQAVVLFHQESYPDATEKFQKLLAINPQDRAVALYLERCQKALRYKMSGGWDNPS